MAAIGNVLLYCVNGDSIGTAVSGRTSEVAPIGRWSLVEVPLYMHPQHSYVGVH